MSCSSTTTDHCREGRCDPQPHSFSITAVLPCSSDKYGGCMLGLQGMISAGINGWVQLTRYLSKVKPLAVSCS